LQGRPGLLDGASKTTPQRLLILKRGGIFRCLIPSIRTFLCRNLRRDSGRCLLFRWAQNLLTASKECPAFRCFQDDDNHRSGFSIVEKRQEAAVCSFNMQALSRNHFGCFMVMFVFSLHGGICMSATRISHRLSPS
jgi:hypothetical protein